MAPRIVVIGSGGRLGAALVREWQAQGREVLGLNRQALDLADLGQVRRRMRELEFDALVNCAAMTNVDECEREEARANRVNAEAVAVIADACSRREARCVHISTDYVFDGEKREPYTEDDAPNPLSKYGWSKLRGEQALHGVADKHLVVRVSWVFGPDRPSFVDQILQRALQQESVAAIADKISVPTFTRDAASLLLPLVDGAAIDGVVHLCNTGACSWQEYGQHALDCAMAAGAPLRARAVDPLQLAEMTSFVAKRPVFTPLSTERLTTLTGLTPRSWQAAVEDYVRTHWVPHVLPMLRA